MRTLQKTAKMIAALCACLLSVSLLASCASAPSAPDISADPAPLSAEQVEKMREDYPICTGGASQASVIPVEPEDLLQDGFHQIYAEVSGEETAFTRSVTVDDTTEEDFDFFEIPLRVLYDPCGKFKEGEEIHLFGNVSFRDGLPAFEEGDRFVALVTDITSFHQEQSDFPLVGTMEQGLYYVTDDGHAIAAYEEPEDFQQNGTGLATLLENYEELATE